MYFVFISEQTVTSTPFSLNWFGFYNRDEKCLQRGTDWVFNPLKPELNPIYLLALLGAHRFLHVSRIRVKLFTFRLLMPYIYIWSTHS
jgi:hypothetical protein